ncbi:MAG TPA: hypothetical protein VL947_05515, partial [Cytophagales bacterium]|nr:hypothetical protein [Cytophagales bacterium]
MLKFNSAKTFYKLACCLSMMVWLSFTVHSQDLVVSRGTTTLSTTAVYASLDLSGGTLIVQSPAILTITGAATVRNTGTLIVNEGATLIVGAGIDLRNT